MAEKPNDEKATDNPSEVTAKSAPPGPTLDSRGELLLSNVAASFGGDSLEITSSGDEVVVFLEPHQLLDIATRLKETDGFEFNFLRCLSVVDYEDSLQVVYHLWSLTNKHKIVLKVNVDYDNPTIPSVYPIWRGSDWFEREGRDLFGIYFEGHPDLKPLLLWEGFEGYPGRKSFPFNEYTEY